jgi:hypothetical protein
VLGVASAMADSARTGGAGAVRVLRGPDAPSALILPVIGGRCQASAPLAPDTPAVDCAPDYRKAVGE